MTWLFRWIAQGVNASLLRHAPPCHPDRATAPPPCHPDRAQRPIHAILTERSEGRISLHSIADSVRWFACAHHFADGAAARPGSSPWTGGLAGHCGDCEAISGTTKVVTPCSAYSVWLTTQHEWVCRHSCASGLFVVPNTPLALVFHTRKSLSVRWFRPPSPQDACAIIAAPERAG